MTTISPRINITPTPAMRRTLEKAAIRDNVSLSSKTAELVEFALNIQEDLALVSIAKDRKATSLKKYITHEAVWD